MNEQDNKNPFKIIFVFKTGHAVVTSNRNTLERLLVILEFTPLSKNQTVSRRYKNKKVINEYTLSVAVNMAGLNISAE